VLCFGLLQLLVLCGSLPPTNYIVINSVTQTEGHSKTAQLYHYSTFLLSCELKRLVVSGLYHYSTYARLHQSVNVKESSWLIQYVSRILFVLLSLFFFFYRQNLIQKLTLASP